MNVIVIGAGAAGTMAAWRLAAIGCHVTVLEQFTLDHDQGSSFGESRIVRRVYPDPLYTRLMAEAYSLWDELQELWRECCPDGRHSESAELIDRSGGLFYGSAGNPDVADAEAALRVNGVEYDRLTAAQVQARYAEFRLPADTVALFEPSMGYARASNAVRAAMHLAMQSGAQIIENAVVSRIEKTPTGISVATKSGERFNADRVLITAGPWTKQLLAQRGINVRMQVTRQVYAHLWQKGGGELFKSGTFPTWIDIGNNIYGFPQIGKGNGVKIASHNHGEVSDPNSVIRSVDTADLDTIVCYANSRFDGLSDKVVYEKVCLYTNTPDEDFLIDAMPDLPGAFVISACSGHGFKFAPLVGQIGADLATGKPHHRDLSRFRLSRLLGS